MLRKTLLFVLILGGCGGAAQNADVSETATEATSPALAESNVAKKDADSPAKKLEGDPSKPECRSPAVAKLLQAARLATSKRNYPAAVQSLSQAIGLESDCVVAYFLRARVYADTGEAANAMADFATSLRLDPTNASIWNARGLIQLTRGKARAALEDLNEAIRLKPDYPEALNNRGLVHMANSDYKSAIADFDMALKFAPEYLDATNNRGYAFYKTNVLDRALADFDNAIRISPRAVNPYNNRGLVHYAAGRYDQAIADFTQAIVRDRFNPKYYQHRLQAYLKAGRQNDALQDVRSFEKMQRLVALTKQVAATPKDPMSHWNLGKQLEELGELESAETRFGMAIQLNSHLTPAYISRAAIRYEQKRWDDCLADCNKALEMDSNREAYSIRGDVYLAKGDYDRAILDFAKAKRYDGAVAEAYLKRSKHFAAAGKSDRAAEDFEKAATLDPTLRKGVRVEAAKPVAPPLPVTQAGSKHPADKKSAEIMPAAGTKPAPVPDSAAPKTAPPLRNAPALLPKAAESSTKK